MFLIEVLKFAQPQWQYETIFFTMQFILFTTRWCYNGRFDVVKWSGASFLWDGFLNRLNFSEQIEIIWLTLLIFTCIWLDQCKVSY